MSNTVSPKVLTRLGWLCFLGAMATLALTLWSCKEGEASPAQNPPPIAFSTSFLGYSNSPTGQRWAVLTVTNRDLGNLSFSGPFGLEPVARCADWAETRWKTPVFIPPHSNGRIAVEMPGFGGTWRGSCRITRYTWKDEVRNAFPLSELPDFLRPRSTAKMEGFVTCWITNE